MPGGRAWRSGSVAAIGAIALLACGAPAQAAHVACGDTITANTTLDGDLRACPGNGVTIAAPGVTLDLGGHTVEGAPGGFGVVARVPRVTVTNGSVGRFHNAVVLGPGSDYVVRDVTVYGSHDGVLLPAVNRALVERVTARGNDGSGITAPTSRAVRIADNHVFENAGGIGGVGFDGGALVGNVVERNVFYGLRYGEVTNSAFERNTVRANGGFGMLFEQASTGNVFTRNRVSENDGEGVLMSEDSSANFLERNRADRNRGSGFTLLGAGAALTRNSATRNGGLGFDLPLGAALSEHNRAHHNGDRRQCVGIACR